MNADAVFATPNIHTSFISASKGHEKHYVEITDMQELKDVLETKLAEYNENMSAMNLVLFEDAMGHVSRISRIIDQPNGSCLLVGVGGSGKQSLSKLGSYILEMDVFRIMPNTTYGMNELRTDLETLYTKAGVQGQPSVFILTDSQVINEKFLVYINDMLSSGWVPDMFPKEEMDTVLGKVRNEAKSAGYLDTPDQLFEYLLDKSKRNLHLALCFSPVGDAFRIRARRFPAIINCTQIDWFKEWPKEALIDVSNRFLQDVETPDDEVRSNIGQHMAHIHITIEEANKEFLAKERRHNYTTPTSYLELINFYKHILSAKQAKVKDNIRRLEVGLSTMDATQDKVEGLKELLSVKMVEVNKESEIVQAQMEQVEAENQVANGEKEKASKTEEVSTQMAEEAAEIKAKADAELEEALPAMEAAQEAVNCLDPKAIQELKGFAKPHEQCKKVAKVTLVLLKSEKKNYDWGNAQRMMNNPQKFLDEVKEYSGKHIEDWKLKKISSIISDPTFDGKLMTKISSAAANLCTWAVNIVKFNEIYTKVEPLMQAAEEAKQRKEGAEADLAAAQELVASCEARVAELQAELDEANAKKQAVEDEAQQL